MNTLTEAQKAHFEDEGFLLIRGLLNPETDICPVFEEYASVLNRLAHELFESGEITSPYSDLPFGKRLMEVYRDSGRGLQKKRS